MRKDWLEASYFDAAEELPGLLADHDNLRARITQLEAEAIYTAAGIADDRVRIDTLRTANQRLEGALRTLHGLMHHKATTPLELEAIRMSEAALRGSGGDV
jgi:hypothetical protein